MELLLLKHLKSHLDPLIEHLEDIWISPIHPSLPCAELF